MRVAQRHTFYFTSFFLFRHRNAILFQRFFEAPCHRISLAKQAMCAAKDAVISHELLAAATPEQAALAVRWCAGAEVHVVTNVRDIDTLLPA